MYGHQVIDDLQKLVEGAPPQINDIDMSFYNRTLKTVIQEIKNAQHFHLGIQENIVTLFKNNLKKQEIFWDENGEDIRLPYKICWFDWIYNTNRDYEITNPNLGQLQVPKRGVLVKELKPDLLIIHILGWVTKYKCWTSSDMYYYVSINKPINEHKELKSELIDLESCTSNIYPVVLFNIDKENINKILKEDTQELTILNMALKVLSCKNISTANHEAPKKLNKARLKKGKQELFTYHTLRIIPFGRGKHIASGTQEPNYHTRIHLCRGHFKRYTAPKALFGKYVGLFWWQPQVRGKDRTGIVVKDYELTEPK